MSQGTAIEPMRADDFTEPIAGDVRYEVIDGQLVELPPMSSRESHLATILVGFLTHHVWAHRLGRVEAEMLFKLDPDRNQKRRPDVAFVSYDRWPKARRVPDSHGWEVVPELAVEVVSPTDTAVGLLEKIEEYFETGVRRVWVVFPGSRCVYDYEAIASIAVLRVGDRIEGKDLLPGFSLALADLFEVDLVDDEPGPGTTPDAPQAGSD